MVKKIALIIFISIYHLHVFGQEEQKENKKTDFTVGLQVNQLIKEIINLNNNSTAIDNPFILVFSVSKAKTGWGIDGGFGFNYESIKDKSEPANHTSKINEFFYRVGVSKRTMIAKKWTAGYGFDFVGNYLQDKTVTISVTDFGVQTDSLVSSVNSITKSFGGGLRLNLGFYITPRLIIGTESNLYFLQSGIKQDVTATEYTLFPFNPGNNTKTETASHDSADKSAFSITAPIAIFLAVKF